MALSLNIAAIKLFLCIFCQEKHKMDWNSNIEENRALLLYVNFMSTVAVNPLNNYSRNNRGGTVLR